MIETVFYVPKLNQASVACGGCCPVPAEAVLLPELEFLSGVQEADANWQTSEIRVRHAPQVDPKDLAALLEELSYPAERWHTRELPATPSRREAATPKNRNSQPDQRGCS